MGNKNRIHTIINYLIAIVWLINGFFCKLLNLVPRHQLIVARILGAGHAGLFTKAIGTSEILMAIWVVSSIKSRACAIAQILLVATMNTIEFFKAADLLLFGKINACIAVALMILIFYNEFILQKSVSQT
jgi:hypothetical protein